MPIIKSAIKRMKQTAKRRERNVSVKKDVKNATKEFLANPTQANLSAAQSEIDTAAKKKLIKKNTASRRKARLSRIAKEAGVKLTATEKKTATKKSTAKKETATKPVTEKKTTANPTTAAKKPAAKKPVAKKPTAKKPAAKKTDK